MVYGAVSKKLKLNSNQCPGKEYFGNFPGHITIKKDIEDRYSKKKGALNTECAYSKMKVYKEGKTCTLTGKVQRINYTSFVENMLRYQENYMDEVRLIMQCQFI